MREGKTRLVPRFEPAPCPKPPGAEELARASCGYLVVPENRSRPTGRTIRLMGARYPARSPEKRADPVVYLAGGPGDIAPLARAPQEVWRPLAAVGPASRFESQHAAGMGPLVERSEELASIRAAWSAIAEGGGRMVIVTGEPGIGKSRLVAAFKDSVRARGRCCSAV